MKTLDHKPIKGSYIYPKKIWGEALVCEGCGTRRGFHGVCEKCKGILRLETIEELPTTMEKFWDGRS